MRKPKARTASELLMIWGLYTAGGAMRMPLSKGGGGPSEEDDEALAADYVQTCPGFQIALPVLRYRYVHAHPESDLPLFDPTMPGERLDEALLRLGWGDLQGAFKREIGPIVHQRFLNSLIDKTKAKPFLYFEKVEAHVLPLRTQMA